MRSILNIISVDQATYTLSRKLTHTVSIGIQFSYSTESCNNMLEWFLLPRERSPDTSAAHLDTRCYNNGNTTIHNLRVCIARHPYMLEVSIAEIHIYKVTLGDKVAYAACSYRVVE